MSERKPKDLIPGEHDHSTETPPQPGSVGGTGFGGDLPPTTDDPTLDEEDRERSRWEGGGRVPRTSRDSHKKSS